MQNIHNLFGSCRIIPVVVLEEAALAVPLARALYAKGYTAAEITFRTAAAQKSIEEIRLHVPEICVGAGTVLTHDELRRAKSAGAQFCVAPGLNPVLLEEAGKLEMPFVPGIQTASEVTTALSFGQTLLKFFPAETAGGIAHLKGLFAAFGHCGVRFMPTGGIREETAQNYLDLPCVAYVGGSWMVKPLLAEIAGRCS